MATPVIEEFKRAFQAQEADALRRLLERHPAARDLIDAPLFAFDSPALVHVAGRNDLALVDVLLDFGADPNRRSDWWAGGFHSLHITTSDAVADRLIQAGAVPDACAAAHLDRIDLLRGILDADPSRVHERGGDGQTPLHFARSRDVVDLLLERGADRDARDVDHRSTPAQWMLDHTRGAGRYELAAYLVQRGASADVFLAAALGLVSTLRGLLEADPSLIRLRTGQGEYAEEPPSSFHIYTWTIGQNLSPLRVAAQFDQNEAADVLRAVENFITQDANIMDNAAWTRVDEYLINTVVAPDAALDAAREATTAAGLPEIAVTPPQGKLLQILAQAQGAGAILEIGTLGGYSTICLARGLRPGGKLITLEIDPKHAEVATRNIARAGCSQAVQVRLGPAADSLAKLVAEGAGPFDLIFVDADKPSTPTYFDWALKLSRVGTLILVDNVVRQGALADPSSKDASVQGVQKLHQAVAGNARVSATTVQTVGSKGYDGLLIAVVVAE